MTDSSWDDLLARLRAEEEGDRTDSGASARSVAVVREKVERAAGLLGDGQSDAAVCVMQEAARQVVDEWSWSSSLGESVVTHHQALETARRRSR